MKPRPADDLGEIWELLESLPHGPQREGTAAILTASTVELAAVTADAGRPRTERPVGRDWVGGLTSAAVVAAALVAGLAAGRITAPGTDGRLAELLPYVRHLELLREAGSVGFLESFAARDQPPPRFLRPPADVAEREAAKYRAELDSLAALLADRGPGGPAAEPAGGRRRFQLEDVSLEERVELEKSARAFGRLSTPERRALELLAEALTDPARPELHAAALAWHQWLEAIRPEDRERLVAAGTEKRLEWIDWYASRIDGRLRPGFFDRPGGGPRGDMPPRPDAESMPRRPPFDEPGRGPPEGPPRFRPERGPPPRTAAPPS